MKIPITFFTRRIGAATASIPSHSRKAPRIASTKTPFCSAFHQSNLADIRRMMSKIYADNLARPNFDSSRGIAGGGVIMKATGRDLSNINFHYYNKFGHYKNNCADFKAVHQQNSPRRRRQHKQRGGHQPHQPKPGEAEAQGKGTNMVLIPQNHHPQRCLLPRQAGKQAQRPRPLRASPSSECSWDMQLVGSPCER